MAQINDILDSMTYHTPSLVTIELMNNLRSKFHELAQEIAVSLSPSRQTSLAFTALEESLTWAMKGLSVQGKD